MQQRKLIKNKIYGEERALYNLQNATLECCKFAGEEDGESALKECRNFDILNCKFELRYPLWHGTDFTVKQSEFTETCRAAMWYDNNAELLNCTLNGIKALRECKNITLYDCQATSPELGWKCDGITLLRGKYIAEYFMFDSDNIRLQNVDFRGKYSFQYTKNLEIVDSVLDTKDAFWHADNVVVKNSTVKGEYLAWYSQNVTFINCRIIGTQPLCYCKNLKLINCTMTDCDLAFEYSDVRADIVGHIDSVKNPLYGEIVADAIGKIVREQSVMKNNCKITLRQK